MHSIRFTYGNRQRFRRRTRHLTIRGMVDGLRGAPGPASFSLNGTSPRPLYVEADIDEGIDWLNGYKPSPAELRCRHRGEFCIEIAAQDEALRPGENTVHAEAMNFEGESVQAQLSFEWNPEPPSLPLDLRDLTRFSHIQETGQIVNGAFDLDRDQNLIRSRAPVAPDALLVLGPAAASQEATFAVRFLEPRHSKWLGLSDFFAGMEEGVPPRGVKVGWSSAGMAVVTPKNEARSFLAWGDHSARPEEWAIATHPPAFVRIEANRLYRVRHQIMLTDHLNRVRFRIWPADEPEPEQWLCDENDGNLPAHLPRHRHASFSLFQHMGMPIEWSDIMVHRLDPDAIPKPEQARKPFLGRARPGAF